MIPRSILLYYINLFILEKLPIVLCLLFLNFSSFAESTIDLTYIIDRNTCSYHTLKLIPTNITYSIQADSVQEQTQISFGLKSGINLARMNFNKGYPPNDYPYIQKWRTGFVIGAFMDIPLNNKWAIYQEYNFSTIRGYYVPYEAAVNLNYLSIPIHVQYSFNPRFHLISGFQFDLLISGKQIIDGVKENITKSIEERNVGLNLGLKYYISKNIFLDVRGMHGLNSIGLWQREGIKEFKLETLLISGGYLFYKKQKSK